MPPSDGFYIICHPATSSFVGVADDDKTVVGYNTLDNAQVWELRAGQIYTTLKNGQTGHMVYMSKPDGSGYFVGVQIPGAGYTWSFTNLGANMWTIFEGPSYPSWFVTAANVGGLLPQNAMISLGVATADRSHWMFFPQSTRQSPQFTPLLPTTSIGDFFSLSSLTIWAITQDMVTAFKEGLQSTQTPLSSMIPSHVTRIPNGKEKGPFLALNLAEESTLSYFELNGKPGTDIIARGSFGLTRQQLEQEATELFKYIADKVKTALVQKLKLSISSAEPLYMGVVFPFPVEKTALNTGILLRWTKEVSAGTMPDPESAIGKNVVELLQRALDAEGLNIKCNALINDTTATLLAQAYESRGKRAIFDIGTNGAYIEEATNIKSLEGKSGRMVVNTEWGSFEKSQSLQRTPFDRRIDRESAHPGKQIFEKLVSTTAIGELTRLVLLHYIDTGIPPSPPQERPLFNCRSSTKLNERGGITIKLMWDIDDAEDGAAVQQLLVEVLDLPSGDVNEDDGKVVKGICRAILLRTARLSACALAATLILMGRAALGGGVVQGGRIGITGGLTESPAFRRDMEKALREIIGAEVTERVLIVKVDEDMASLGAAVCASMAESMNSN